MAQSDLEAMLRNCDLLVGETNYRDGDVELARRNRHMTASEMGRLAARSGARELVLFHLSDRYTAEQWGKLLDEVRQVFPGARFPSDWNLEQACGEDSESPRCQGESCPGSPSARSSS